MRFDFYHHKCFLLIILLGYRGGKFSNQLTYSLSSDSPRSGSLATGDFNNDHYLDVALVNAATKSMHILFGYENDTFVNTSLYYTGISSDQFCFAVSDLNTDNHLESVVTDMGVISALVFSESADGTLWKNVVIE